MFSFLKGDNEPNVSFSGNTLIVGERSWKVDYSIHQAIALKNKVIVLYDPDCELDKKFGQFPNLVAFNFEGKKLWTAELPTTQSQESYYQVNWQNGLKAETWTSYSCRIDEETGRIISKVFYK
jgi:hypothetical protein